MSAFNGRCDVALSSDPDYSPVTEFATRLSIACLLLYMQLFSS
jgi:hypothetical protein